MISLQVARSFNSTEIIYEFLGNIGILGKFGNIAFPNEREFSKSVSGWMTAPLKFMKKAFLSSNSEFYST